MKKAFGSLGIVFLITGMLLLTVKTPAAFAASQADINNAIDNGLAYLATTQAADGHWGSFYYVATTAKAVLAFENAGHLASDPLDPYQTNVQKGLDYLFANAYVQAIGVQPAGDPDTNGNGFGIYFNDPWGQVVYQTPMVLMAIVGSQTQTALATTGPVNVIGRQYNAIVTDIVDWLAWGQCDPASGVYRGGWRYGPNDGSSDNSLSQWPTLGLMTAELWGINAPAFVKTELLMWTAADQNLVGTPASNYFYGVFDYMPGAGINSIAETATGILELTYCGVAKTDPRIIAAEGYINRDWLTTSGWRCNLGNFYGMYAVMKACRLATPTPIQFIANYDGTPGVEWYNGLNEYADILVAHQYADGHWAQWVDPGQSIPIDLSTAWGVLILEFHPVVVNYKLTVTVLDAITGDPIEGATVLAEGPATYTENSGSDGEAVFDPIQAGVYQISATAPPPHIPSVPQTVSVFSDTEVITELVSLPTNVIPEVPVGTIAASISMTIVLLGYLALPRLKKKRW